MPYQILRPIFEPAIKRKIRHVAGREHLPKPPFIVAANHVGFLDPIALVITMLEIYQQPMYCLTNQFMWTIWGGPLASRWLAMIPVYKKRKKDSLQAALAFLKKGKIIGIFPEGTRNTDSKHLLPGKTGAIRLALRSGVPIIPLGIINTTGRSIGQAFGSLWRDDSYLDLHFGPALDLNEFRNATMDRASLQAATQKLMQAIAPLCQKKYLYNN